MSATVRLTVSLTLRSPFLFQGLANAMLGIDAAQLRGEDGRPVIPADQIKGVLRAACEALAKEPHKFADKTLINKLFGRKPEGNTDETPAESELRERGLLIANDLTADRDTTSSLSTTRIEIDDETGAVKSGALQVAELVAKFGEEVPFTGTFHLLARDGIDVARTITMLDRAIKLIPAIGAFKSAGFGEVVAGSVTEKNRTPGALPAPAALAQRLAYSVTFDRPILVDATRETDNLFIGADVIPGAAFKGALAERLRLAGINPETHAEWSKALAALRISHAFPEDDYGALSGFRVPASLLNWKDGGGDHFADALLHGLAQAAETGFVTQLSDGGWTAPQHPVDWKWKKELCEALQRQTSFPMPVYLPPQPRTHVTIDADKLVAKDGELFTTVAKGMLRQGKPRPWRLVADMADVDASLRGQLRALFNEGFGPLGRTGAWATFKPILAGDPPNDQDTPTGRLRLAAEPISEEVRGHDGLYALTLVTPALLTDPRAVEAGVSVKAQYCSHITACTGGGTVLRSYTTRRLAGGYIATRHRPYGETYYPFVLTEPGSVFLVKGGNVTDLDRIARFGLPPVTLTNTAKPQDWRNCPYLTQNGYGEVAFSLVDHAELRAKSEAGGK